MTEIEKMSYALGMNICGNISELPIQIDMNVFMRALNDAASGNKPELSPEEYRANMQMFQKKVQEAGQEALTQAAAANVEQARVFLEENAKKDGVKTTASGLQYSVLTEGDGPKPTAKDRVRVHYAGTLLDGTTFDSSVARGEPAEFGVTQVIAGWTEALQMMSVGSKYRLFIPANLAYGDRGAGEVIPPGAALIFDVELLALL